MDKIADKLREVREAGNAVLAHFYENHEDLPLIRLAAALANFPDPDAVVTDEMLEATLCKKVDMLIKAEERIAELEEALRLLIKGMRGQLREAIDAVEGLHKLEGS